MPFSFFNNNKIIIIANQNNCLDFFCSELICMLTCLLTIYDLYIINHIIMFLLLPSNLLLSLRDDFIHIVFM